MWSVRPGMSAFWLMLLLPLLLSTRSLLVHLVEKTGTWRNVAGVTDADLTRCPRDVFRRKLKADTRPLITRGLALTPPRPRPLSLSLSLLTVSVRSRILQRGRAHGSGSNAGSLAAKPAAAAAAVTNKLAWTRPGRAVISRKYFSHAKRPRRVVWRSKRRASSAAVLVAINNAVPRGDLSVGEWSGLFWFCRRRKDRGAG